MTTRRGKMCAASRSRYLQPHTFLSLFLSLQHRTKAEDLESLYIILKDMEIKDREEEWNEMSIENVEPEKESLNLPNAWFYGCSAGYDFSSS